jgi:hypothetical protein|tara:strand:+ start:586 stop:1008 length:423 start_codon:yes stop_codon:yes gene_type:complete
MKSYDNFISESLGIPLINKALKKRFKGTTDISRPSNKSRIKGSIIGSVSIPKVKGSDVEKFLQSLGYTTEESFDGFIDMFRKDAGTTYKANIVSSNKSDVVVRLSSHLGGKSSKSFRKDTHDYDQAQKDSKFSGKSPRYR